MALLKTDEAGYVYDESSGVVINKNEKDLLAYRKQIEQSKKINTMKAEFESFKDELAELKKLLLEKR